jgi:hypothetical protein
VARIVLQPCRILWKTFVPAEGPKQEFDLPALVKKLAPENDPGALGKLRAIQIGSFIGLSQTGKGMLNFVLLNHDRSGSFEWIDKKDPTFEDRVREVYRVEEVTWDGKITEPPPVLSREG